MLKSSEISYAVVRSSWEKTERGSNSFRLLAENVESEPMRPDDQFEAFEGLTDEMACPWPTVVA